MMALSNLLNEPRREITETIVGILIAAPFGFGAYLLANWTAKITGRTWWEAFLMDLMGLIILGPILAGIHVLGEEACDSLQRRGIRLRPTREH